MSDFNINEALTAYLDDPHAIATPEAASELVECENDPEAFTSGVVNSVLNDIIPVLGENPEAIISQPSYLDSLQFLLKCAPTLSLDQQLSVPKNDHSNCELFALSRQKSFIPSKSLSKLFDFLISTLGAEAETVHHEEQEGETDLAQHKQVIEIYAFLLQWCIAAVQAKSEEAAAAAPARGRGKGAKSKAAQKDGEWEPAAQLQTALDTMARVMKLKLSKIFVTTSERDTFIGLLTRPTYHILESEVRAKDKGIRMHAFKVLCVAIKHHGHAFGAQTSIIQNLTYYEHLAEPMAELLNILAEQYDHPQLAEEVMKELSSKEYSPNDVKGPKSVSAFVTRLSELAPRVVQRQITYLAKLLESENYTLRCAIIELCGNLIIMLSSMDEAERREEHRGQLNAFFDVLEERFLDVSPYCRSKTIQVYTKIFDSRLKEAKRRQKAAELATRALEEQAFSVRRSAIKLIRTLMETHPFILEERRLVYSKCNDQLEEVESELAKLRAPEFGEPVENEQTVDEAMLNEPTQMEPAEAAPQSDEEVAAARLKAQEEAQNAQEVAKLQLLKRHYLEALLFIETMHDASAQITQLLSAKNKSEVIEAMDFFVNANKFGLETANTGIRRMLRLIWTKGNSDEGKGVQTHLIECYRELFFTAPPHLASADAPKYVAYQMMGLTSGLSPAELTSLEQLLSTMMKEKAVGEAVIRQLWAVYGQQQKKSSRAQRRGAIIVLGMLALADRDIIVREMETCLRIGLGVLGKRDLLLARYTCVALMRMTDNKPVKGTERKPSIRLPNDHAALACLAELLEVKSDSKDWYGMAEQAVGAIYALSKHPDVLAAEVIRRKTKAVFARKRESPVPKEECEDSQIDNDGDVEMGDDDAQPQPTPEPEQAHSDDDRDAALALSQLLFVVGHVALKQIVHLELCEQDFKRRKAEKEKSEPASAKKNVNSRSVSAISTTDKTEEDNELDLIGGTTEDDFTEAIAHVRDRELLYGKQSLLAHFGPLVKEICSNNTSYPNSELQAQSALCMAKLMCVSQEYCEANLLLLITILERSPSPITRSNLVVALGDMAVCFNHLIDENTNYLYHRLSDSNLQVRRTCLMTLTFLILAGQVKVKGQLGEMAKCVEDHDERIRAMSRMFFSELAGKDNAVYNNFVDIFSLLSGDETLGEERFRKIIKFLAGFVEKEKHAKQLASKLAARLPRAKIEGERQWEDLTFVLKILPHKNEEIKKLINGGKEPNAQAEEMDETQDAIEPEGTVIEAAA